MLVFPRKKVKTCCPGMLSFSDRVRLLIDSTDGVLRIAGTLNRYTVGHFVRFIKLGTWDLRSDTALVTQVDLSELEMTP